MATCGREHASRSLDILCVDTLVASCYEAISPPPGQLLSRLRTKWAAIRVVSSRRLAKMRQDPDAGEVPRRIMQ